MNIFENFSLKNNNTFGVDVKAQLYVEVENISDIIETLSFKKWNDFCPIGQGSNILFTKDFKGIVLNNISNYIEIIEENENDVIVEFSAGVVWDDAIKFCLKNNFFGLENLIAIPGKIGAAPVQNIGAYGVEQKDCFEYLKAIQLDDAKEVKMYFDECEFDYRYSIFKGKLKNKYYVTAVAYRLKRTFTPNVNFKGLEHLSNCSSAFAIANAIENLRKTKLPDYTIYGNAGSFFKNPIVSKDILDEILKKEPTIVYYRINNDCFKLSAANLIELSGWKGKRTSNCGVSEQHSLVIVNYGNASGEEIFDLSQNIIFDINNRYNIQLEREVLVI